MYRRKVRACARGSQNSISASVAKQVLLLIDWDNLFISLYEHFGAKEMRIEKKLEMIVRWVKEEIGELLGGYGFVFAPEHLAVLHQQSCVDNGLRIVICPKRPLEKPKRNLKTGDLIEVEDTVDETIIWFTKTMMRHPNFGFLCLVTGDSDYIPLLKEVERYSIKRALVFPTRRCLSESKELVRLADKHPKTLKIMRLRLDT